MGVCATCAYPNDPPPFPRPTNETQRSLNDPNDATHLWECYEEEVADMVDQLKAHLSQIHPGIGDQITLARFCKFVRLTSSCLL